MTTVLLASGEKHTVLLINEGATVVSYSMDIDTTAVPESSLIATLAQLKAEIEHHLGVQEIFNIVVPFKDKRIDMFKKLQKELNVVFYRLKNTIVFDIDGKMTSPRSYSMYLPG